MEIDMKTVDYLSYYHYEEFASSLVYANDHVNLLYLLGRLPPSVDTLSSLTKLCMKYCHYDLMDRLNELYGEGVGTHFCSIM